MKGFDLGAPVREGVRDEVWDGGEVVVRNEVGWQVAERVWDEVDVWDVWERALGRVRPRRNSS